MTYQLTMKLQGGDVLILALILHSWFCMNSTVFAAGDVENTPHTYHSFVWAAVTQSCDLLQHEHTWRAESR